MTTRLTQETRDALDQAAKNRSPARSVSQEAEIRIRESFDAGRRFKQIRDEFGGSETYAILQICAHVINSLEQMSGKRWTNDAWAFDRAIEIVAAVLGEFRPAGEAVRPRAPMLSSFADDKQLAPSLAASYLFQVVKAEEIPISERKADGGGRIFYSDTLKSAARQKALLGPELVARISKKAGL